MMLMPELPSRKAAINAAIPSGSKTAIVAAVFFDCVCFKRYSPKKLKIDS